MAWVKIYIYQFHFSRGQNNGILTYAPSVVYAVEVNKIK